MMTLPVYVSPTSVSIIEDALASSLPMLPCRVRFEAMARGLGYCDGVALKAMTADRKQGPVEASGQAFATYLRRLDYQATASMFYEASALSALHLVAQFMPLLGRSGYGPFVAPSLGEDPRQDTEADRADLASSVSVPGFLQAMDFLRSVGGAMCNSPTANSYTMKHFAERRRPTYPDGSQIGAGYVANGEMVAAGIYHGLKWSLDATPGSRNILFNIDLRKVERRERRAMSPAVTY